jgi:Copper chaperone
MASATFHVTGMTCGHCVASVTEEVESVPGVRTVEVALPTGRLTVTAEGAVDAGSIRAAVEEAGYQVVLPSPVG